MLLAFGVAEGRWTGRWTKGGTVQEAAARLDQVPLSFGEWQGEARELDARQVTKAELSGHLMRQYTHKASGTTLSILLVCGRPGPVAVHTPDVCYGGVGFALVGSPTRDPVTPKGANSFKIGKFQKVDAPVPEYLRIFWAWSGDGHVWTAPDNPRLTFASLPALYKLYVIRQVTDLNQSLDADPGMDFLRQFLPIVAQSAGAVSPDSQER
jgi:hypothetical protein